MQVCRPRIAGPAAALAITARGIGSRGASPRDLGWPQRAIGDRGERSAQARRQLADRAGGAASLRVANSRS
jgi:hypothetical protein